MDKQACPECGYEVDSFKEVTKEGGTPTSDSLGVCANCKTVHGFTDEGVMVPLTEEQKDDPAVKALEAVISSILSGMGLRDPNRWEL